MATRTTLNVSLSVELGGFVERLVHSGRYSSASEVVRSALRLLKEAEEPSTHDVSVRSPDTGTRVAAPARSRVLIAEDEPLIAMDLEFRLDELGYVVSGRAATVGAGVAMARELAVDLAVLDVNLAGHDSGPIADVLRERGIPVVFASGYTEAGLPATHRNAHRIAKPYETAALRCALESALAARNS